MALIKRLARISAWLGLILLALVLMAWLGLRLWPHQPLGKNLTFSQAVYDSHGQLLRLSLSADQRYRLWTPLESIPPRMREAVLRHEDRWFYWHPGFNPASLLRAARVTYLGHGPRQGGSTITMQLARMHWDLHSKDIGGKLLQILRALQLEACYSKDEILEAYLNYAPYGGNVEGIGTASLVYFNKPLKDLALPEILALAVIPQAPGNRLSKDGLESKALHNARLSLYQRWIEENTPANTAAVKLPLLMRSTKALPLAANHMVNQVLATQGTRQPHIFTTLDLNLQKRLQQQITSYLLTVNNLGVNNASALLLDYRDMSVKAMVGSADFFNAKINGQVNGARAKRSPGSTLKPFIYALALDQGILHPHTLLKDLPYNIGNYSPENFDLTFQGPLSATQALIESRNIPAVQLSSLLRQPDFYTFLKQAGISNMASPSHYGLSLVLGGGEVTMQEMAALYAMLANHGKLHALRLRQDDKLSPPVALLSPEASFITLKMLEQNRRPGYSRAQHSFPVYWKTGTSWGFRDAWCAGVFGPYVLVVWLGNFSGQGNPALVGREMAAPLFFAIADSIMPAEQFTLQPPSGARQIEVCAISGMLPNQWCPHKVYTWFIPGKSPITLDDIHRPVLLAGKDGSCQPAKPGNAAYQVHEFWPSDLARNFALAGLPRLKPPANACRLNLFEGKAPTMISPQKNITYFLPANSSEPGQIALNAVSDAMVKNNYWFINDAFYAQTQVGASAYWQPEFAGKYLVRVVDDNGRADSCQIVVEVPIARP